MADILSQDEINALMESYKASGGADETSKSADRQVRLYDFARPDKFCKEHLRALNAIHSKHASTLAVGLASVLRTDAQVNLLALDQLTFREYCASVPDGTLFAEVSLEPLASTAIFEFNPTMVSACVDLLAGGYSVSALGSAKLTDIDRAVMKPVVELSLRKYADAWASNVAFKTALKSLSTESTSRQIMLPSEGVLVCGYEVSVADNVSMMSVCIRSSAIEGVLPALTMERAVNSQNQKADKMNDALRKSFEGVEVECRAVLGRTALPLGDVADLAVGDLIALPTKVDGNVELWIENVAAFAGTLGRSGKNLAVRVSRELAGIDIRL